MSDSTPPMPGYDFEESHGKVRPPSRPRVSDLTAPTAEQRRRNHGQSGRFEHGNNAGSGRGWKGAIKARLRRGIQQGAPNAEDVAALTDDAWKAFTGALRELPSDGQHVRSLLALKVQHEVLAAWWQSRVYELGLGTTKSVEAEERFAVHSRRVEQLTASVLGAAKALAVVKPAANGLELLRRQVGAK